LFLIDFQSLAVVISIIISPVHAAVANWYFSLPKKSFLPRDAVHSAGYAVARCLSVG